MMVLQRYGVVPGRYTVRYGGTVRGMYGTTSTVVALVVVQCQHYGTVPYHIGIYIFLLVLLPGTVFIAERVSVPQYLVSIPGQARYSTAVPGNIKKYQNHRISFCKKKLGLKLVFMQINHLQTQLSHVLSLYNVIITIIFDRFIDSVLFKVNYCSKNQ